MKIKKLITVFCALQSISIPLISDVNQEPVDNETLPVLSKKPAHLNHLQFFLGSLVRCNIPLFEVKQSFKTAMHQIKQEVSQNSTMTDPQIIQVAIAKIGEDVSKFIQQYGIKDQKTLVAVAKFVAKENGEGVSKYIQNYGIEDPLALIEIAKIAAEQNGEGLSKYIQNYEIKDNSALIEIAKIAARQNGTGTFQYIGNYGINNDEFFKEVVFLAKSAEVNPLLFFENTITNATEEDAQSAEIVLEQENETAPEILSQEEPNEAVSEETIEFVSKEDVQNAEIALEEENQTVPEISIKATSQEELNEIISGEAIEFVSKEDVQNVEIALEQEKDSKNNWEAMESFAEELGGCSGQEDENVNSFTPPPITIPVTEIQDESVTQPVLKPIAKRKMPLVEAKLGYFFFTDSTMSSIYNQGGIDAQVSGSYPISEWFHFYGSVEYLQKSGRSLNGFEKTTISQIPLSLGIKASIPILQNIQYYLSIGPRYFFIRSHNYSSYVPTHMNGNGVGGFTNAGFLCLIGKHFTIDLFGEYSYGKIQFHTSQSNTQAEKAQIGGLTFGGGIGYSF